MYGSMEIFDTIERLQWIDFTPSERVFSGTPTQDTLDQVYEFLVTADDGYSQGEVAFYIDMSDPAPYLSDDPNLAL